MKDVRAEYQSVVRGFRSRARPKCSATGLVISEHVAVRAAAF